MLRRWLLVTLTLGLLAAPVSGEAEQAGKVRRIGWLDFGPGIRWETTWPFLEGLRDFGWVEGENLSVEYRSAQGNYERLTEFAAELVRLKVDVLVAAKSPAAVAAKRTTSTIPVVMVGVGDPIGSGLVSSLARPGRNITGVTSMLADLTGKQLELLKEVAPGISRVAILWDPANPDGQRVLKEAQLAAQELGITLQSVEFTELEYVSHLSTPTIGQIERAFSAATRERAEGLILVLSGAMFAGLYQIVIADLALKHGLPMISNSLFLTEGGGLMSYLPSETALFRRAAAYVDKILRGSNPADLPVEQPREFELVLNLKTAKALGITFPDSVLIRATKVIE